MDKEAEKMPPSSIYELLYRVDERQNIIIESFKDVKDEITSIKIDFRTAQDRMRDEVMKSIDNKVEPLIVKVSALEQKVQVLENKNSELAGGSRWSNRILDVVLTILLLYISYKATF
jgi:phage-related minor tail protein